MRFVHRRSSLALLLPVLVISTVAACAGKSEGAESDGDSDRPAPADAGPALDSLNARIADAYRTKDTQGYAAFYTDSGVFEWPAVPPVRGRDAVLGMVKEVWAPLRDVELKIVPASRRLAPAHATEFGAFVESWTDSAGVRRTEYGRYAMAFARGADGAWKIDRFLGFEDSTKVLPGAAK